MDCLDEEYVFTMFSSVVRRRFYEACRDDEVLVVFLTEMPW